MLVPQGGGGEGRAHLLKSGGWFRWVVIIFFAFTFWDDSLAQDDRGRLGVNRRCIISFAPALRDESFAQDDSGFGGEQGFGMKWRRSRHFIPNPKDPRLDCHSDRREEYKKFFFLSLPPCRMIHWLRLTGVFIDAGLYCHWFRREGYKEVIWLRWVFFTLSTP